MRIATALGVLLSLASLAVVSAVLLEAAEPVALVALFPFVGGAIAAFSMRRMFAGHARDAHLVLELATRATRRRGEVRDSVPYASAHGGAVLGQHGALMVLQVALEAMGDRPAALVAVLVMEPSEVSRARVGRSVVVLEHPEEPALRALEGFLPNGLPEGARK